MPLTFAQACTQYDTYAGYQTAADALLFAQACVILVRHPSQMSIAGRSQSREALMELAKEARGFAQVGASDRPPMFSRARVTGMGR